VEWATKFLEHYKVLRRDVISTGGNESFAGTPY
jgi:hypothetical protein